jgi:hypothetical protein
LFLPIYKEQHIQVSDKPKFSYIKTQIRKEETKNTSKHKHAIVVVRRTYSCQHQILQAAEKERERRERDHLLCHAWVGADRLLLTCRERERGVQYNRTFGGEATTAAELTIVIQEEARAWDMAGIWHLRSLLAPLTSASSLSSGPFRACKAY